LNKIYIYIPDEIDFIPLTYNQIVMILLAIESKDKLKDIKPLYHHRLPRLKKDLDLIKEKYFPLIERMKDMQERKVKYKKEHVPYYFKMKAETLRMIMAEPKINKRELLIIILILRTYQNTFKREWEYNITEFLSSAMGGTNVRQYKNDLINVLNITKNWSYKDGSVFIKDYKIEGKKLTLFLDDKGNKN